MAAEAERGCGFRKVGGLYLCGGGSSMVCDRLPYELNVCPTCGAGVKFSRGFQWLNWLRYADVHVQCIEPTGRNQTCPVCDPNMYHQPYGLLWVGEDFYTPASFIAEAMKMGVSRRIPAPPRNLKLGESWVLLAHRHACGERPSEEPPFEVKPVAGVFYAFRPHTVELLVWESQAVPEHLADLAKRNITPIIIPDGDVDHDPRTSLKPKESEKDKLVIENIRNKFIRRE